MSEKSRRFFQKNKKTAPGRTCPRQRDEGDGHRRIEQIRIRVLWKPCYIAENAKIAAKRGTKAALRRLNQQPRPSGGFRRKPETEESENLLRLPQRIGVSALGNCDGIRRIGTEKFGVFPCLQVSGFVLSCVSLKGLFGRRRFSCRTRIIRATGAARASPTNERKNPAVG